MADVSVEFGAVDVGLQKTLKTIQDELTGLRSKVNSGELSIEELGQTMRRVGQVESMEKRIKNLGLESQVSAAKVNNLESELSQVGGNDKISSLVSGFGKFTSALAGAYAAIQGFRASFAFVGEAIKSASDLGETTSKVGQIFGSTGSQIESWAKATSTSFGQSQQQAMDAAATFAIFGKGAGLAGNELVGFSQNLVKLSADFASFYNASPEEAINAIGAALRGESEPIRRFGVLLDDATLKAEAMRMGLYDGTGTLDLQAKSLAAYNVILKQTTDAQGDFARTSDGLANQTRILEAEVANLKAEIGTGLLPSVTTLVTYLNQNTIPAFVGAKAYLDQFGKAAGDVAKKTGLTKEGTEGAGFAFKNLSTAAFPALGILFKLKDAQDFLAKKGNEVRDSQKEAAEAINGATGSSNQSAKGFTEAGLAAAAASGEFSGLGSKADQTGDSIADAFTINSDFKPAVDGISSGWSDLNSKIAGTKPLLENNFSLTDSITGKVEEQVQSIGGQNDELKITSDLKKLLLETETTRAEKEKEIAAKQAERQAGLRENLELDLGILKAKISGNEQEEKALEYKKDYNAALKQAIDAGMGKSEAEAFADQIARARQEQAGMNKELSASQKLLADIAAAEGKEGIDRGGRLSKRAQDQIARGDFEGARKTAAKIAANEADAAIRGTGPGKDRRNIADIGKDYGLRKDLGETDSDFRKRILAAREGTTSSSPNVDKPGQDGKTGPDKSPDKSGGKPTLDTLVDQILKLVQKIEPRLPVAALSA